MSQFRVHIHVDYQALEIVVSKIVLLFPTTSDWELDSLYVLQVKHSQEAPRGRQPRDWEKQQDGPPLQAVSSI